MQICVHSKSLELGKINLFGNELTLIMNIVCTLHSYYRYF